MAYFFIFLQALPYILQAVKAMEVFFPGKGEGANKKAAVMQATQAVIDGGIALSTGGQKETWEKVAPLASTAIDLAAGIMFPSGNIKPPDSQ